MFIEPHLKQGQEPRWCPAIGYAVPVILPFFVFGVLIVSSWIGFNVQDREFPHWKAVLSQAEHSREKGDLYEADTLYSQAARIASWRNDWVGLISVACGIKRLDGVEYSLTIHNLLVRALLAAESTRSRTGVRAVAKAFTAAGEDRLASAALSRIQKDWLDQMDGSASEPSLRDCWGSDEKN